MGYAQLDDSFWCNPKIVDLPALALRLYVRSISFSSALNTGGAISKGTLRVLDGNAKLAAQLVTAALWDVDGDGWHVHDYAQYNISKAKRDAARENARKRWQQPETPVSHDAKTDISHDANPPPTTTDPHDPKEKVAGTGAGKEQQELASCDAKPPMAGQPIPRAFQLAESLLGRTLRRLEHEVVSERCESNKPEWVCTALEAARTAGKPSLQYAWTILDGYGDSGPPERSKPNGNRRSGEWEYGVTDMDGRPLSPAVREENQRILDAANRRAGLA